MVEKAKKFQLFKRDNTQRNKNLFYTVLIAVALIGGGCAFFIPLLITSYSPGDNVPGLRQTFLTITGGTLAILTLWETRRKNDQEYTRQVHAERRSRYATAIEQLADEKAPIRLGGVYTLVKLVDEWLADEKTLPNEEERQEEGQIIVNSLCAYIRSSIDLASKAEILSQDKAPENYGGGAQQGAKSPTRFYEEQELQLTILEAIKTRLNGGTITQEDGTKKLLKGPWSDFDYDFSNAHFFCPVDFANSYFGASSNFSGVEFTEDAEFSGAKFSHNADFFETIFTQGANFSGSIFTQDANFSRTTFFWGANFSRTTFAKNAIFSSVHCSHRAGPKGYNFEVSPDSSYKIETREQEHNGGKFIIPKDTTLFDPHDWTILPNG